MTERITDHDEIREVADQIIAEQGDMSLEQLQQEFRVHDLEVSLEDLESTVQR